MEDQDNPPRDCSFHRDAGPEPPKEDTYRYVAQWRNPTGLRVPEKGMEKASPIHNQKYLDWWHKLSSNRHLGLIKVSCAQVPVEFRRYGYSLISGLPNGDEILREGGPIANLLGALSCIAADTGALMWRSAVRCRVALRRAAKAILPEVVVQEMRRRRERIRPTSAL